VRVVLDANVVIAAAASRGLCESVFELCLERHELVCCDSLLQEIETVRPCDLIDLPGDDACL
jgi:predicted nucleic acid-binding protein